MTHRVSLTTLTTLLLFFSPLQAAFFNNNLACVNAACSYAETAPVHVTAAEWSAWLKGKLNATNTKPSFGIKTVVIDAGHGGHDPGCSGAGSHEKHLALAIAKAFAANLETNYPDLRVILTRDEDVFIPLHERAAIANRARADLFISIHCNAMPPNNAGTWGTETYVMGLHTAAHNLDVAKRENNAILLEENYERNYDYDPNSPEGHILLSMFQNAFLEQSILLAERMEHHFAHTAERKSRGVKQAGFVVLKETAMPSVLVETGFLTNKQDEEFLSSAEGQALIANALLVAFSEYKAMLEGVAVPAIQLAVVEPEPRASVEETPPTTAPADYRPAVADYDNAPPVDQPSTPPPANQPNSSPTTPAVTYEHAAPAPTTVRAEPIIVPDRQVRGTRSVTVPAHDRALEPRGVGNTNWALELGREAEVPAVKTAAGLVFCVQLAAAPQPLDTRAPAWQNSQYLIEVLEESGMYKYQVRNFPSMFEADNARQVLRGQGFKDAFIVAYHDGKRISTAEARALLEGQ